jgi:signal peptidase II
MIGCDQLSKQIVRQRIAPNEQITVIRNVMSLTRVENTGAFLSLGDRIPRPLYKILMIILPLLVLGYLVYYLIWHEKLSSLLLAGYCLIAGGGFGNIIDRIIHGSVTDFMYFNFGLFHTGIVNLADIFITAGFAVLVVELAIVKRKSTMPLI